MHMNMIELSYPLRMNLSEEFDERAIRETLKVLQSFSAAHVSDETVPYKNESAVQDGTIN